MPNFNLSYDILELHLRHTFTIARGSKSSVRNVLVTLEADGISGIGEAGPNKRYDETAETVIEYLNTLPDELWQHLNCVDELTQALDLVQPIVYSARVAVEMAWLDWWAKSNQQPLYELWEAPSNMGPQTSYTIGIDEPEIIRKKIKEAEAYPILKVKLGTDHDRDIIGLIREMTDKPIRVDINEGWTDLDRAYREVEYLASQNIELIEQPMPADQLDDMVKLTEYSPIPLCADESFKGFENLDTIAEAFDCINIKLMKIGSMIRAKEIMEQAKEKELQIMIGCMIESSLADTASGILSLWADYADLDGHLLIDDDPFCGFTLDEEKHIIMPDKPGLGVTSR